MNTTTRRFSRTLADAFPDVRAHWLEHHPRAAGELVPMVLGFLGAMIVAVLAFLRIAARLGL